LVRRGLTLSAGSLAALLSGGALAAGLPAKIGGPAASAALLAAACNEGGVSAQVIALTKGVLQAMFLGKLKIAGAVLLAATLVGGGAGVVSHRAFAGSGSAAVGAEAPNPAPPAVQVPAQAATQKEKPAEQKDQSAPNATSPDGKILATAE